MSLLRNAFVRQARKGVQVRRMASGQERAELDAKARQGETVVPGGTGGKTVEAQEHLAEGNLQKPIYAAPSRCLYLFIYQVLCFGII